MGDVHTIATIVENVEIIDSYDYDLTLRYPVFYTYTPMQTTLPFISTLSLVQTQNSMALNGKQMATPPPLIPFTPHTLSH